MQGTSLWVAMGSVLGVSRGCCAGSLEVWVVALIVDAGRGAVDGSSPVTQLLLILPAIRPLQSPAVQTAAERSPSSLPPIQLRPSLFRFGTIADADSVSLEHLLTCCDVAVPLLRSTAEHKSRV